MGTKADKVVPRPETQAEIHILGLIHRVTGFPGDSNSKESAYNAGDLGSIPGSGRFPREGNGLTTSVFWPGEFHGWRSLAGYSPWDRKESDRTERLTRLLLTTQNPTGVTRNFHDISSFILRFYYFKSVSHFSH